MRVQTLAQSFVKVVLSFLHPVRSSSVRPLLLESKLGFSSLDFKLTQSGDFGLGLFKFLLKTVSALGFCPSALCNHRSPQRLKDFFCISNNVSRGSLVLEVLGSLNGCVFLFILVDVHKDSVLSSSELSTEHPGYELSSILVLVALFFEDPQVLCFFVVQILVCAGVVVKLRFPFSFVLEEVFEVGLLKNCIFGSFVNLLHLLLFFQISFHF